MENLAEAIETGNNPNTRAIIEEMRANGATDTEIIEFLLKVLPTK